MPTYQYACTECGHAFEQFQSFSEDSLTECPECAGELRKLFNAVGVVFKGSGFYRTDSRSADSDGPPTPRPNKADDEDRDQDRAEASRLEVGDEDRDQVRLEAGRHPRLTGLRTATATRRLWRARPGRARSPSVGGMLLSAPPPR